MIKEEDESNFSDTLKTDSDYMMEGSVKDISQKSLDEENEKFEEDKEQFNTHQKGPGFPILDMPNLHGDNLVIVAEHPPFTTQNTNRLVDEDAESLQESSNLSEKQGSGA